MPEALASGAAAASVRSRRLALGRLWTLRLGLVLLSPLVALGVLEVALRVLNVGGDLSFFVPDEEPGYFRTNPAFTSLFFPEQFDLRPIAFRLRQHKAANAIRVFVLGESAVFGTPEPAFSMAEQLRVQLRARYPKQEIEVFNLGMTAVNSHVILRVVRDVLGFEPDVLVIYTGNNEIVGPYGPGSISFSDMAPLPLIRASVWLRSLRVGQILSRVLEHVGTSGAIEWQGMRTFSKNAVRVGDPRLLDVHRYFEANLRDAVQAATAARVHTVLSTVVANLKDTAPFLSVHREGLSETELKNWEAVFNAGLLAWRQGDNRLAAELLGRALKLDPDYADTCFLLGTVFEASGHFEEARTLFTNALDRDALRFRPVPQINAIIRRVGSGSGSYVTLLDAARELGADPDSQTPVAGHELLFEHVHFNFTGNQRMGRLLAETCAQILSVKGGAEKWLNENECAVALGYTEYGRLGALFGIRELTKLSPFTNQITFGQDQTRLSRAIDATSARLLAPDALKTASTQVAQALTRDDRNAFLAVLLEEIEFQRGNYGQALALLDKAAALRPKSPDIAVKKANVLRRLKRHREAESILIESLTSDPSFLPTIGALAEVWAETAQLGKAREFFGRMLKKMPHSRYLRRSYADLLMRCGDHPAAERFYREIWQLEPGDEGALVRLSQLLTQAGKQGEALELMLEGYRFQPRNYANNARLAQIFDARNEAERAAEFMKAMTESGPANSALCLRLAQRLGQLNRRDEMMVVLRQAREAAEWEGNDVMLRAIEKMVQDARADRVHGIAD